MSYSFEFIHYKEKIFPFWHFLFKLNFLTTFFIYRFKFKMEKKFLIFFKFKPFALS
jgi:hypothetical protein